MISHIEMLNYRCIRYVSQDLGPFHVLVGPNASGKTTFLDVITFLGRLVSSGVEPAVYERTTNVMDLVWNRSGATVELAVESEIPENLRPMMANPIFSTYRYEVAVGLDPETGELSILAERAFLSAPGPTEDEPRQMMFFPQPVESPSTILMPVGSKGRKVVINKKPGGNDNYYSETSKRWNPSFRLGPKRSALGNLPDDESRFPVSNWFRGLLADGIHSYVLNSRLMRKASPPGHPEKLLQDGSNLPWIVERLKRRAPDGFADWLSHLRAALPDLADIRIVERPDDKHKYLVFQYTGGTEVPTWMISDGTLRLIALTLPAHLPWISGIHLIEEPENGIHPKAVEVVYRSLSSVKGGQILMATHSPVVLGVASIDEVLCFAKTKEGETDIVSGPEHPALRDWKGEINLSALFAGGILG